MVFQRLNALRLFIWLQVTLCMISPFSVLQAQTTTSLFIPGFDPQPVSADIIGIGDDGRTTWILQKGERAPGDTSSYDDFVGTATLIQGPNDAYLSYGNPSAQITVAESCTITETTLAVCTVMGNNLSGIQTVVYTQVPVQFGYTMTGSVTILPIDPSSTAGSAPSGSSSNGASGSNSRSISSSATTSQTASLASNTASSSASPCIAPRFLLHAITLIVTIAWVIF